MPAVDFKILSQCADEGDVDSIRYCIDLYLKSSPEKLRLIEAAIREQDSSKVELLAHQFKGSNLIVGAKAMTKSLQDLEIMAEEETLDQAMRCFKKIKEEFVRVQEYLAKKRSRLKTSS